MAVWMKFQWMSAELNKNSHTMKSKQNNVSLVMVVCMYNVNVDHTFQVELVLWLPCNLMEKKNSDEPL